MKKKQQYIRLLDSSILRMFRDALRISIKRPSTAIFFFSSLIRQYRASRLRLAWERRGVHAPPFMILSVTSRCNLKCKGCYAGELHRKTGSEMDEARLRRIITEADELGISIIILAGGEPLSRPEILKIARDFPKIIFPLFTNGLLITEKITAAFKKQPNIIPILSLEGYESDTDSRRGPGVYQKLRSILEMLNRKKVSFGVSLTMTETNFGTITGSGFIKDLIEAGANLFFFVEYVPAQPGTDNLVLSKSKRTLVPNLMKKYRKEFPGLFIAFPGDEAEFGGCLSSGRGFVHVGADGSLEPCPFAPYSDSNLKEMTLKEALKSRLLREIRENHDRLNETKGGCALWENREWVQGLAQKANEK